MSSDEQYGSFLDQANQDTGAGAGKAAAAAAPASSTSRSAGAQQLKTTDTEVPTALEGVEEFYTSESDEPFEVVSLKWEGRAMCSEGVYFIYLSPSLVGIV